MTDVAVRAARPGEAAALSALALRSKAHWGYDDAYLAACRAELTLRPGDVAARRTAVAERGGRVLGLATLDGEPPDGELGLLFVEPDAIGGGIGRTLYRHVLAEAARLGFERVRIVPDPHATGFYLALGAERDGRDLVARPVLPEPAWAAAWDAGGPAVRIGNAAEFNGQFGGVVRGPDHYACLTAFCGARPAALVLPEPVPDWWARETADALGWGDVPVHSGVAPDGRVSAAVAARPELRALLTDAPGVPWGRSAAFGRLVPAAPELAAAIRRYESKRSAHTLFRALGPQVPGVAVPAQRPVRSRRVLARELARAGDAPVVVKSEYGVGGSGTLVVPPDRAGRRAALRVAGRWPRGGAVVEEYVAKADVCGDPTFDAVIGGDGAVHPVGVGSMAVAGTGYRGVTVGPGAVPDAVAATATAFGTAVGRALAADGYRGWFDVDFVRGRSGALAPAEINLRLTGPAAAFCVAAALDRRRAGRHLVRTLDRLPLGARLPDEALREHVAELTAACGAAGATALVTIPTAAFDPAPYLGLALAARTPDALDAAEAAARAANTALGAMFRDLDVSRRRRARVRVRDRRTRTR
ncbi:GNAT family N-acetyltransferase [Actinomadura atramentaria]|uniref:GNAT family N-acetyltransferase n=1 Tax=Actinomadura atramentaria TaxID=1990 RepID=UPI00035D8A28|nr:GNAT family N-acetyltransferase [Actinomadura atramentaria]